MPFIWQQSTEFSLRGLILLVEVGSVSEIHPGLWQKLNIGFTSSSTSTWLDEVREGDSDRGCSASSSSSSSSSVHSAMWLPISAADELSCLRGPDGTENRWTSPQQQSSRVVLSPTSSRSVSSAALYARQTRTGTWCGGRYFISFKIIWTDRTRITRVVWRSELYKRNAHDVNVWNPRSCCVYGRGGIKCH